jgi:hypothetical protein
MNPVFAVIEFQADWPSGATSNEHEPFTFGEVAEVLEVEGRQGEARRRAAGGVLDRPANGIPSLQHPCGQGERKHDSVMLDAPTRLTPLILSAYPAGLTEVLPDSA